MDIAYLVKSIRKFNFLASVMLKKYQRKLVPYAMKNVLTIERTKEKTTASTEDYFIRLLN